MSRPSLPASLLILIIRGYQAMLSPFLGGRCRFYPTCSEYGIEALRKRGAFIGGAKAAWRLLRCHPFCKGGYDPVDPR